jgi:predicted CoA-binding protein
VEHEGQGEQRARPEEIAAILGKYRVVAVVGLSPDISRPSYRVAQYLKEHGYRIVPVNPGCTPVLGEKCYPSLRDIPFRVEIVDIFRKAEAIPAIVEEAMAVGALVVWMQLGLVHEEAARRARKQGLLVVMDRCLKIEHEKRSAA